MAFSPLGAFNPTAPLNPAALAAARVFEARLPVCPAGSLTRIYLHWSVGHYDQDFNDYNGAVRYANGVFSLDIPHDPRDNARGVNNNEPASHTYRRNTGAFGFSTDDMVGAGVHDFGSEPVTLLTLEYLCAGAAAVAKVYGIDLNGKSVGVPYAGEPTMLTHAEAANLVGSPPQYDAYGPPPIGTSERWDLASFTALPAGVSLTADMATACGNALRARAHLYKAAMP